MRRTGERGTVEHARVKVTEQADDRRSNERDDIGAFEDLFAKFPSVVNSPSKTRGRKSEEGRTKVVAARFEA